jgi:hypothetical protein
MVGNIGYHSIKTCMISNNPGFSHGPWSPIKKHPYAGNSQNLKQKKSTIYQANRLNVKQMRHCTNMQALYINSSWMIILNILLNKHLAQFASYIKYQINTTSINTLLIHILTELNILIGMVRLILIYRISMDSIPI